jgi:fatty acid desaturase
MSLTNTGYIRDHEGGIGDAKSTFSFAGSEGGLALAVIENSAFQSWFEKHDGPTLLVAAAIYASWLLLLASHDFVPWWITAPLAGFVVQWHSSLQHEAIHSMRGLPKWLRRALVWPPIGVSFPFELYRRSHSQHHRNRTFTHPVKDTESYYHREKDWKAYGDLRRWLFIANQTFLGRIFIGPFLGTTRLFIQEAFKMISGDISNVGIWFRHFIGLALMLRLVRRVFDMSVLSYMAEFVYTGFMFGMMRNFIEHRWSEAPSERTAVVESNWVYYAAAEPTVKRFTRPERTSTSRRIELARVPSIAPFPRSCSPFRRYAPS